MAQKEGRNFGRINASNGTAITTSNVAVGAGWGDGAVVVAVASGSNDQRGTITITSVGSNQAQATATVTLTFADGAYSATPQVILTNADNDNSIDTGRFKVTSKSAAAFTATHSLLPVATKIYNIHYVVIP